MTFEGHAMTIEGTKDKCKRVRLGKTGCTIETCRGPKGRWRFQRGTKECPRERRTR